MIEEEVQVAIVIMESISVVTVAVRMTKGEVVRVVDIITLLLDVQIKIVIIDMIIIGNIDDLLLRILEKNLENLAIISKLTLLFKTCIVDQTHLNLKGTIVIEAENKGGIHAKNKVINVMITRKLKKRRRMSIHILKKKLQLKLFIMLMNMVMNFSGMVFNGLVKLKDS